MNEKLLNYILIGLIGVFLGGVIVYNFFPKKIMQEKILIEYKTKIDTIVKTKFIKLKGKIEYIPVGPEYEEYFTGYGEIKKDSQKITMAYADTTIDEDKLKLNVKYYIEPNLFDIKYNIKELEHIRTIVKEPKLFVGIGGGVGFDGNKFTPQIQIGLYYNLKSVK